MTRINTRQGIYGPDVDPPDARRRRELVSQVSQVRERLTSKSGEGPNFDYEVLLIYANNQLHAPLVTPLLGTAVAIMLTIWVPITSALVWLCSILVSQGIMMSLCRSFIKSSVTDIELGVWRSKLSAAEFFYAVTWASLALTEVPNHQPETYVFVFATLIIVLAIRTMLSGVLVPTVYIGTLPITIAITVSFVGIGGVIYYVMAAIALGAQFYFTLISRRIAESAHAMLTFRAEKESLITELEEAKAMSDEARRRAESSNIAKSRFLATMSHELRTPLNAILGFSEVMKSEILGPHANPKYAEYAGDIHRSGEHLLNLINEILDLSRVEAGQLELHEEAIGLVGVVEDCVRLVELRASEKGVALVKEFEPQMPKLWADERALRQISLNLLSNAIKFTPNGGTITIRAGWTEGGGQYLSVRDTGPGIPEEEIPQVLTSFGQGSHAQKIAEQGAGLGLPIVMGLVELHDGTFDLQSKLREGTAVTTTFPRKRVMKALPPVPDAEDPQMRGAA